VFCFCVFVKDFLYALARFAFFVPLRLLAGTIIWDDKNLRTRNARPYTCKLKIVSTDYLSISFFMLFLLKTVEIGSQKSGRRRFMLEHNPHCRCYFNNASKANLFYSNTARPLIFRTYTSAPLNSPPTKKIIREHKRRIRTAKILKTLEKEGFFGYT
jgi:hypothetical protein